LSEYTQDHPTSNYTTFEDFAKIRPYIAEEYLSKAAAIIEGGWVERCHRESQRRARMRMAHKEWKRRVAREQKGWFKKTRFWLRS
jgi:hypothetical protein